MGKRRNFAFIIELFLLFVILLFVIVVITKSFVASREQSLYARHLTESVYLAEEVAEVSMSAADLDELSDLLAGLDQTTGLQAADRGLELAMDFTADSGKRDSYRVTVDWDAGQAAAGAFAPELIKVYFEDETEPVYRLETGTYQGRTGE